MFHIGTVVLTEMFLYWTRKFISLERGILEQNFQFCGQEKIFFVVKKFLVGGWVGVENGCDRKSNSEIMREKLDRKKSSKKLNV
jgi:hypothetical protein